MIATRNIDNTEPSLPPLKLPILSPGNHKLKINKLYLKDESKIEFGTKLILEVETEPVNDPNFKGFAIDPKDLTKGTYKGQVGKIEWSRWGFKDFLTNSGVQILKEEEILKTLKTICQALHIPEWFENAHNRFETIENFVDGFSSEAPFANIYAFYCIGGREFLSKTGKHINHQLQLAKDDRVLGPAIHLKGDKVQKFFYANHVEPIKTKSEPTSQTTAIPKTGSKPLETREVESNEDWLASINAPVEQIYHKEVSKEKTGGDQPAKIIPSSKMEEDFLNAGSKSIDNSFTQQILSETSVDINTGSSENPFMPWDSGFDEWEKANKKE